MKSLPRTYFLTSLLLIPLLLEAQALNTDDEILAQRGNGKITQADFTARADKIPADARHAALRDTGRLQNVLNTMLLRAQLAADAREAGFDQKAVVKNRMKLAADTELGDAWLDEYVKTQPSGDYEVLAQEYYQLNKQDIMSSERIDVSHILFSTKERTLEEARELAISVSLRLTENPSLFDELVMTYSDDSSKTTNKGRFFGISKGEMIDSFDQKAFSMKVGEISSPVETTYGFHIIRLDKFYESEMMSFDAVKGRLIEAERKRHEERIKQQYLSSLSSLDVQMTKEALEEMINRQLQNGDTE